MKTKSAMKLQRMKLGYTLKELAELLDVSSPFLSLVESGYENIPKGRAEDFNKYYGGNSCQSKQ